jgi:diacylglycerol kinase family enzyme
VVASTAIGFVLGSSAAMSAFEHSKARITVEGRQLPLTSMLIVVASVIPKLVLWFKPFREKEKYDDKPWFYFLAIDIDNWEVIKNLRTMSRGTFPPHEKIFNDPVSSAKIESDCGFTLDGELFHVTGKTEVSITAGPSLNFLTLYVWFPRCSVLMGAHRWLAHVLLHYL